MSVSICLLEGTLGFPINTDRYACKDDRGAFLVWVFRIGGMFSGDGLVEPRLTLVSICSVHHATC